MTLGDKILAVVVLGPMFVVLAAIPLASLFV